MPEPTLTFTRLAGREPATAAFTVTDLAAAVRRGIADLADARAASYAGVSLGGAVALELAIDPGVFSHVSCIAGAARIGEPEMWHERAALVRRAGTPVMVSTSAQRWFVPGFPGRDPATANRLLLSLSDADAGSYALACEALAAFDLWSRLAEVRTPLLIAPGEFDAIVPASLAAQTAVAAPSAVLKVVPGCGHLPPAEVPVAVASLLDTVSEEAAHG
jgi:pimeloyl-ACP methyl ester carboxylesterase